MPTYDYRCGDCGHEFELVQSMTAPVKRKCPACAKLKLERLIGTGAGFIIKGKATTPRGSSQQDTSSNAGSDAEKDVSEKSPAKADTADSVQDSAGASKQDAKSKGKEKAEGGASAKGNTEGGKAEQGNVDQAEKRISGATSTPTHAAREGRGVGNLVDKARRLAKSKPKAPSRSKGPSKPHRSKRDSS